MSMPVSKALLIEPLLRSTEERSMSIGAPLASLWGQELKRLVPRGEEG
jgi:hypothetical protein